MVDAEEKREAGVVEVHLSLESLERRVEERLDEKVNYLLERLDSAVQVSGLTFLLEAFSLSLFSWYLSLRGAWRRGSTQKVNFLLERLNTAVQVEQFISLVILMMVNFQGMEQNQGSQETGMKNFREEMAEVLDR